MERQRIDKWLWHARVVRTRTAAAALVDGGLVRINGVRADAPSRKVGPGDVLTVALDRSVRLLRVTGQAERRGSAGVASLLFEDLTPPVPPREPPLAPREPGAGRPTKRDRRALDRLHGRGGVDSDGE